MTDVTLTRKQARKLVDLIPDKAEWEELITALDQAQGDAGDDGEETVTITITGQPIR